MNKLSKIDRFIFLLIVGTAVGLTGCAAGRKRGEGVLMKNFVPPQKIAILPFRNNSNDLDAPVIARDLVRINLLKKGYTLIDEKQVDSTLKETFGISDGGQLNVTTPQKIGNALGTDGLLYGTVEQFKFVPTGAYTERTAEVELTLIRSTDSAKLFENQKKASDKKIEITTEGMLKSGLTAVGEKTFQKILGHPLRPITASAVNKCLRSLPPTPTGMPDFGTRTWDEVAIDERCVTMAMVDDNLSIWTGTEIDIFSDVPICYKPTGLANYDSFFDKVNLMAAKFYIASTISFMIKSGKKYASNGRDFSLASAEIIPQLVSALPEAIELFQEGQALILGAPKQFAGLAALKLPQVTKAMKLSLENLTIGLKEGKKVLAELKPDHPSSSEEINDVQSHSSSHIPDSTRSKQQENVFTSGESLVFLDFVTKGVADDKVLEISDTLESAIIKKKLFTVIRRKELLKMLKQHSFNFLSCKNSKCAAKFGKSLGASKVIFGEISGLESIFVAIIRIADVKTAEEIYSAKFGPEPMKSLKKQLRKMIDELTQGLRPQ